MAKFDNVKDAGRLYDVNAGGAFKVRIGVFPTRAEADAAAAMAKQRGYTGAFVVADSGMSAKPMAGGTPPPITNPPVTNTSGAFKVQLGAFGKPENFDRNKAGQLGTIETTTKGNLTVFMVGGIQSLEAARSVQTRAQNMGYTGAFILQNVNGSLQKVR
jgi:cell division septation protein DedD